ncbi:glycoside hydrolase family 32 protein [Aristaeella hokkaidonensis]|uniref:Glycoside hydrolase family 32 protein n=1 Tax=Aristaeella hokkaidonensis TaxID=3046382 RepID=A0AC61N637_9FIRM|nr:glycoside hydrolase family 32 protein [Aristaeella hokkaidonensis]QUC67231.1 glycoside hydrolase family 32 protein [Aristaeella hokkaidonensis]SNT93447.1 beta-fructofuranosidase [Aristaeella hokkaidonensis]
MKKTVNHSLLFARAYEQAEGGKIPRESRPVFHLTPLTGWMNDPNGFCYYHGQYHLFYQYNPYDTEWDAMHWGHAVSHDLLHWTYLPAALAPDAPYDSFGCFSGSAAELPDGRHLLMYTGVRQEGGDKSREFQTQCIAVGDGTDYQKYEKNPVLDSNALPEGLSPYDFRDPKIWRTENGAYRCVVGARREDKRGVLLQYESRDGFEWRYVGVLAENDGRFGLMWECPDFFPLDGKHVLFVSPQDMLPEDFEYHNGNGTVCLTGRMDGDRFVEENNQAIDYGIDFYAPQTILTPDGRRVMIGWMQNWDTCKTTGYEERPWFGQMSLPRELFFRNGRLYQQPVRELAQYRSGKVEYRDVLLDGEKSLEGIEGRVVELDIHLRCADPDTPYQKFIMKFAQNEKYHSVLSYRPYESWLQIDRKFSGSRRAYIHQRRCLVSDQRGEIRLHVILDRFSMEVFINDGEQVMTATILTGSDARKISFEADGQVMMDVTKYSLIEKE